MCSGVFGVCSGFWACSVYLKVEEGDAQDLDATSQREGATTARELATAVSHNVASDLAEGPCRGAQ